MDDDTDARLDRLADMFHDVIAIIDTIEREPASRLSTGQLILELGKRDFVVTAEMPSGAVH